MSEAKQKKTVAPNMTVKLTEAQHKEILSAWLGSKRVQGDFRIVGTTQTRDGGLTIDMMME